MRRPPSSRSDWFAGIGSGSFGRRVAGHTAEALPVQALHVEALVERLPLGHDPDVELAFAQQLTKLSVARFGAA